MRPKQIRDFYYTDQGDFFLGQNGDLEDTRTYLYRGLIQKIRTRMESNRGDWAMWPDVGAGLQAFRGRANTRELGEEIKSVVTNEVLRTNSLSSSEFTVDVIPTSDSSLMIILYIKPAGELGQIILPISYDMRENKIIPRTI